MESLRQPESDTLEFWKKQAKHYEQKANEIQQELDEYTENSASLEKELEASLEQVEKQLKDTEQFNQRLKNEIENLRIKLDRSHAETNALENELQALKKEKEKQAIYVRELEQKNDDLERGQRVISESVSCIESLLNQAYERNAVLENEVDEVENLRVKLQRANDEARDLKQELKVVEREPLHKKEEESTIEYTAVNGHISNINRSHVETETQTVLSSPQKREINGNGITPSTRVSAMNIVGDLIRRVGLERFLCRECGKLKCSCNAPTEVSSSETKTAMSENNESMDNETIEYRNPRVLARQQSEPETPSPLLSKPPPYLHNRSSENPFTRAGQGENGKLRRSFAQRSREGIENLLSFSSKKNQDQKKSKEVF